MLAVGPSHRLCLFYLLQTRLRGPVHGALATLPLKCPSAREFAFRAGQRARRGEIALWMMCRRSICHGSQRGGVRQRPRLPSIGGCRLSRHRVLNKRVKEKGSSADSPEKGNRRRCQRERRGGNQDPVRKGLVTRAANHITLGMCPQAVSNL